MVEKPVKDKEPIMWDLPLPVISGNGYGWRKPSLTWWAFCIPSRRGLSANLYSMKNPLHSLTQGNNFLSVSLALGFLLIAVSISYSLLMKPIMRRISLDQCLDAIKEQKQASDDEYKATHPPAKSAYDTYLNESSSAPDNRLSQKEINDAEAKCYDRYK